MPLRSEPAPQRSSNAFLLPVVLFLPFLPVGIGIGALWTAPGPISAGGWTLTGPVVLAHEQATAAAEAAALATFRSTIPVYRPARPRPFFRLGPFRLYRG